MNYFQISNDKNEYSLTANSYQELDGTRERNRTICAAPPKKQKLARLSYEKIAEEERKQSHVSETSVGSLCETECKLNTGVTSEKYLLKFGHVCIYIYSSQWED